MTIIPIQTVVVLSGRYLIQTGQVIFLPIVETYCCENEKFSYKNIFVGTHASELCCECCA